MGKRGLAPSCLPGPGRATTFYDHASILHGDFAWLNGSKFRRAGWGVGGARVGSLRL